MNCPKCGHGWSNTIDCRMTGIDKRIRKACAGCGHKFTIYELYGSEYKRLHKIEKTIEKILSLMEVLKKLENEDN